jgi:hypothetical protein
VFVREESRGDLCGFAGGIDPIRGRDLVAEVCIRPRRLKHSVAKYRLTVIVCMMPRCAAYAVQQEYRSGKKQPTYAAM